MILFFSRALLSLSLRTTLGVIIFTTSQIANAQTVVNANDRGWYNNNGSHNPSNNNTFTGFISSSTYRSYYRFTIPAGISCIQSATLELELENYYGSAGHAVTLYDVDPVNVPNLDFTNGSGSGVAIHTDLGAGVIYGTQTGVTSGSIGTVFSFALPATALTNIVSATGSDFAVGARLTPSTASGTRGLRFSAGSEARVHRLTYTECPLMPNLDANKTISIFDPLSLGLYAVPGNDTIYSISVTNLGTGSADMNSMLLIDAIPPETTFYNGDVDDGGPQTNPVSFSETGTGLTLTYSTDVAYSNAAIQPTNFAACNYIPTAGYDSNVTYICINPKGAMVAGSPDPNFTVSFRVKIN